jgi:hypothetical protein
MSFEKRGKLSVRTWRRCLGIVALVWWPHSAAAQTLQWARQFAASKPDATFSIAADSSGAYVAGMTRGGLPGQTVVNTQQDAFVRKYDPTGKELWTREFAVNGGPAVANGVAVDATGVYVVGRTAAGGRLGAGADSLAIVNKYDTNGNLLWTHQTSGPPRPGSAANPPYGESAVGVALNGGGVYVAGNAEKPTIQSGDMYLR